MRLRLPVVFAACVLASALAARVTAIAPVGPAQAARVAIQPATETALDRYVKAPDPAFRFSVVATRPGAGHTAYLLEMVSQRWRTAAEVDRPEWRHWLTIIKPDVVAHPTALLSVAGGDFKRPA